jgi:hypothetical protein
MPSPTVGYVTVDDLDDYAEARGTSVIAADPAILLLKALDWLELQPFKGYKTDPTQALQFPRDGETTVPDEIQKAQMAAALLIESGGDLMGKEERIVKSEQGGPIRVEYATLDREKHPVLYLLLRRFVASGSVFEVVRV